jgi:hypothetical protein
MAGQYITLGEAKAAAIYRGDLEGILDRHPNFSLNFEVNASIRHLRQKMATNDVTAVLTPTALLSLPTAAALSGAAYWAEIAWPSDAVSVHGLDVLVNGEWDTIDYGVFEQRRRHQSRQGRGELFHSHAGAMWCVRSLPQATATPGAVMVFPIPGGGQYVLWYLSQWVDILTDTAELPGQEAWLQWVIWDVAIKALIRDVGEGSSEQLNRAIQERDRVWSDIKPAIQRVTKAGPIEVESRYPSRRSYGYSAGVGRLVP